MNKINELVKNKTEQNDENINKQRIEWGRIFYVYCCFSVTAQSV